jgi:hypothetical protein
MAEPEYRDRELENLLGQFLVASFQSDKLAELIYDRLRFRNTAKEMKILLTSSFTSRPPLLVTIRVEPYNPLPQEKEVAEQEALRAFCVLESPALHVSPADVKNEIEEIVAGSLRWWSSQGHHHYLKLDEWRTSIYLITSRDHKEAREIHRILQALESKRKGEASGP